MTLTKDPCYDYPTYIQPKLDAAMPWVGLYIVAASAVCILAVAADAFNGLRRKKLWLPCKYFSLNAATLTLLAVAMKLPVDLTTNLNLSDVDRIAKYLSVLFMATGMANFASSLGSMTDSDILANVVALAILVFTITGNIIIQIVELWEIISYHGEIALVAVPPVLMLLSFVTLASLAITVSTMKRSLETKYQEMHKAALAKEEQVFKRREEAFSIDEQRKSMMKYWVMAETSSPQFVMARSVVSTTQAVICLLAAILLATVHALRKAGKLYGCNDKSTYGDTILGILYVQSVGVVVAAIAPVLRWLIAVGFNCSEIKKNGYKNGFKIEAYWIQTLLDWRDSFSALPIDQHKCRKYLHSAKWVFLTICIGVQILIVLISKLLVLLSLLLVGPFFFCIMTFVRQIGNEDAGNADPDLSRYVLLLEGEVELPRSVMKSICHRADNSIKTGRKRQPENLVNLLGKSVNFSGVGKFDSDKIPSLHSEEPPNCWTLPVVTLASIAIALPNVSRHKGEQLLSSVSQGFSLANIVEKTLTQNAELANIQKAADICWVGVVLYMKWLDIDLEKMKHKCENSKAVLQELSEKAKGMVLDFKKEEKDPVMENPVNWPAKVLAANSMYRISRTILLSCGEEDNDTDEELLERLSIIIADILAACLTNLARVISVMCHKNAIEEREKSVREAFLLLGRTERVMELLQQKEWPHMDHDKAACIDEWRAFFPQDV